MLFKKKPDESSTESRRLSAARSVDAEPAAAQPARPRVGSPTQSVIDSWLTITGNLESQGDIRIEGHITGDIRCANLVIGRDAMVNGDIIADEAVVRGKVKGTIRANRVMLQDTACVESAIYHKMLSVDEGACFDGQACHRSQPHQVEEATVRVVKSERDASAIETFERNNVPGAGADLHSLDA